MNEKLNHTLLSRLVMDCKYYINNSGVSARNLWAQDEQEQINKMREIWNKLEIKPEWLTLEQIDEYAKKMGVK